MTGYTSGTQARDGRTVNHDPRPVVVRLADGRVVRFPTLRSANYYRENYRPARDKGQIEVDRRHEYAVLDNPILADFRRGTAPIAMRASSYLIYLNQSVYDWRHFDRRMHDHARRVLEKLAVVYA